ncbi:hypothetical protein CEXT_134231, partial [Caerostris extrusa]
SLPLRFGFNARRLSVYEKRKTAIHKRATQPHLNDISFSSVLGRHATPKITPSSHMVMDRDNVGRNEAIGDWSPAPSLACLSKHQRDATKPRTQ